MVFEHSGGGCLALPHESNPGLIRRRVGAGDPLGKMSRRIQRKSI